MNKRVAGLVLFAFALALRLALGVWQGLNVPPEAGSDAAEYVAYATSLAEEGEYRGMSPDVADPNHLTAYRTPGTSLVYAAAFLVFGHRFDVLRILNCIFGALTCLVVLAIGREVCSEMVAWIAAIGWAVYPRALLFNASLLSESLGLLTFVLFLLVVLRFAKSQNPATAIGAGILLGSAILVHPARLFMVPFVIFWGVVWFWRQPRLIFVAMLVPVFGGLTVLPWTIRNYLVLHEFIPLSTAGGSAMLQGNNRIVATDPVLKGYSIWDTAIPEYADALRSAGNEVTRDRVAGEFAKQWIREHPREWLALAVAKLRRAFTPLLQPQTAMMYRVIELCVWGPVLLLMIGALWPLLRQWLRQGNPGWLLHLVIVHFVAITVLFFGNSRYRFAIEPVCILFAAWAAVTLVERWRGPRSAAIH